MELLHLLLRSLRREVGALVDWKERAQDRECLRCKHKGNKYKHYCDFHARRLYQNQSPFIILLRDLPVQVLKTLRLPSLRHRLKDNVPTSDERGYPGKTK